MSESLRSLTKNEKMSELLIFSQKTSDLLRKPMSKFPTLIWKEGQADLERRSSGSGEKHFLADLERSAIIAAMERSSSGSGEKFKRI